MNQLLSKKNLRLAGVFGLGMVTGAVLYIKDDGLLFDGKFANAMQKLSKAVPA